MCIGVLPVFVLEGEAPMAKLGRMHQRCGRGGGSAQIEGIGQGN